MSDTNEDCYIEELISNQEKTIEMMKLKQFLTEDITIQRELLKHQLMEGKSFSTRSSYTEELSEEDAIEVSDDDIKELEYDEDILLTEIELLKDLLSQINDDHSALKLENLAKPLAEEMSSFEEGRRSSEESFINGKQLYRDIVTGTREQGRVDQYLILIKADLEASLQYDIRKEKDSLKKKCDHNGKILKSICDKKVSKIDRVDDVHEILNESTKLHQQLCLENYKLISLVKGIRIFFTSIIV